MKRPGLVWPIFGICIAVATWASARLGSMALSLERAEATARRQAALEENVQLALWRLDSALAPLMAEESARPYFTYSPMYPAERAFTCMFAEIQRGDVLMPSPLLTFSSPQVCLHFQYDPAGRLSSPEVPAGNMRDLAEARYLAMERIDRATQRLEALRRLIDRRTLAAALDLRAPAAENDRQLAAGPPSQSSTSNEYIMRSRSTKAAQNATPAEARPLSARSTLVQGSLQAIWVGPTLVLARRVQVEEGTFLQGCWLDWEFLRRDLLNNVTDLVPGARLEPVPTSSTPEATRMLASLPVRLVPGATVAEPEANWSPVRLSLWIAWACLLLAAIGFAWVLHGTLALSERRGTFVSAVTHELRTPLTTFRLYTEMLDEGMVAGPDTRHAYLKTLRAEADRLGHLVENVLSFARLERGRPCAHLEIVTATEMLERLVPRLSERAAQAGMELIVGPVPPGSSVRVDLSLVEQVLLNLVDNAIKYAGAGPDRRIHLDVTAAGRWLLLTVRDHGPGLHAGAVRRLFRPFSKSAQDAAQTAPGVGLGLALSRRLARAIGGELRLQENGPVGACFAITIPLVDRPCPASVPVADKST